MCCPRRGFANAAAISGSPGQIAKGVPTENPADHLRYEVFGTRRLQRKAVEAAAILKSAAAGPAFPVNAIMPLLMARLVRNRGFVGETEWSAVVLGASMSGLFAARVLADFYSSVTVVDRDLLPQEPGNRRGVPQGAHIHSMQARGSHALQELFPGLREELAADGAPIWDDGDLAGFHVSVGEHVLTQSGRLRYPKDSMQYFATRPLLESHVRRRLRAYPNVTIRDGHDVVGLTFNTARNGVTGVRLAKRDTVDEKTLAAELVVDATGRGSRTPTFLADLGYGRPHEDELVVHLAYATQPLHIPSGSLSENFFVVNPKPGRPTGFGLQVCENDMMDAHPHLDAGPRTANRAPRDAHLL